MLGVGGSNNLTIGDAMIKGWELARDLESSYGIQHFLEGAPFILEQLSNDQKRIIKKIVKGCYRFNTEARFPLQRIAIQKVRVAPSLCVDLHYTQDEIRKKRNADDVRTICDAVTSFSDHDAGFNRTAFIENVKRELEVALNICTIYPQLAMDFQVKLDKHGHIYHFDFDRIFQKSLPIQRRYLKRHGRKIFQYFKSDIRRVVCCATNTTCYTNRTAQLDIYY